MCWLGFVLAVMLIVYNCNKMSQKAILNTVDAVENELLGVACKNQL